MEYNKLSYEELTMQVLNGEISSQKQFDEIVTTKILDKQTIKDYFYRFDAKELFIYQTVPNDIIADYLNKLDFTNKNDQDMLTYIISYQYLSKENIDNILDNEELKKSPYYCTLMSKTLANQIADFEFLKKYINFFKKDLNTNFDFQFTCLYLFLYNAKLTTEEIDYLYTEFKKPNGFLNAVIDSQDVNFDYIAKHKNDLSKKAWYSVFSKYKVTEDFIVNNNDIIDVRNIDAICKHQKLSKDFVFRNAKSFNSKHRQFLLKYQNYKIDDNLEYNPTELR